MYVKKNGGWLQRTGAGIIYIYNTLVKSISMKFLLALFLLAYSGVFAQDKMLLETKYFHFHSNPLLNVHLFLYKHGTAIKTAKLPNDSLSYYLTKAGLLRDTRERTAMISAIKYYQDSITTKDMLFDSTMRKFSVMLAEGKISGAAGWQLVALKHIKAIEPFFKKQIWPSIDSANNAWIKTVKPDLTAHEEYIVSRLQKIYNDTMPASKIRIDLGIYATWAGAYSYSEYTDHIVISTFEEGNQGRLGVEIVFHEGSHFIIDKVYNFAEQYFDEKKVQNRRSQPWHIVLFYTTGLVVKEAYAKQGINFEPYYQFAKFEERIPPFRLATDALALYWVPYMRGESTQEEALKKVIDHILSNGK